MTDFALSDSIVVATPPDELYALVSDVTRTGEWSPTCKACWWDDGATAQVGSWFTGRNETSERTWETRSQVVVADPGREFAWEVNNGWVRWGYTFEPYDFESGTVGTRLTESWLFHQKGLDGFRERYGESADEQIQARRESAVTGIPVTLAAIKRVAEAG